MFEKTVLRVKNVCVWLGWGHFWLSPGLVSQQKTKTDRAFARRSNLLEGWPFGRPISLLETGFIEVLLNLTKFWALKSTSRLKRMKNFMLQLAGSRWSGKNRQMTQIVQLGITACTLQNNSKWMENLYNAEIERNSRNYYETDGCSLEDWWKKILPLA